ncbi:GrpB family protein [bacterium]|nr:GrpB family protein [bacterium]
MKDYKVEVVAYDSNWPIQYEKEKTELSKAITGFDVNFDHFGSTSIPNVAAKPIIDIGIDIKDFSVADQILKKVELLGYNYESSIENFIPDCRFLWKGEQSQGPFDIHKIHVHIRSINSDNRINAILFRDYLRSHPETAEIYSEMKILLAKQFREDQGKYNHEKTTFVNTILSIARKAL